MTRQSGVALAPRLARLARTRSPEAVAHAAVRVGRAVGGRLALDTAARTGMRVLVGPWLGEVGYELLYWLPFLRRELRARRIPPERVTVLTRGGAAAWYGDVAARAIEIFDLLDPDEFRERVAARAEATGTLKQLTVEPLDRELLRRARATVGPAVVLHPLAMYSRLRWFWEGARPLEELGHVVDFAPLRLSEPPAPPPGLPERYVALKAYFSHSFPDDERGRTFLRELVDGLRETHEVVLLEGARVDDHEAWGGGGRLHRVEGAPRENLAVQTSVVSGAAALVGTYGGFAYLGPLLGVPTVAFRSAASDVALHGGTLDLAAPGAAYDEVDARRAGAAAAALAAVRALARP